MRRQVRAREPLELVGVGELIRFNEPCDTLSLFCIVVGVIVAIVLMFPMLPTDLVVELIIPIVLAAVN